MELTGGGFFNLKEKFIMDYGDSYLYNVATSMNLETDW